MVSYGHIPKVVKLSCKIRPKITLMWHLLGILKNMVELKATLHVERRKIYELEILPTHQNEKFWSEKFFLEILNNIEYERQS